MHSVIHIFVTLSQIFWLCMGVVGLVTLYRRDRRRFFGVAAVGSALGIVAGLVTYIIVASTS